MQTTWTLTKVKFIPALIPKFLPVAMQAFPREVTTAVLFPQALSTELMMFQKSSTLVKRKMVHLSVESKRLTGKKWGVFTRPTLSWRTLWRKKCGD
jgi:hypothetical protein